jgi:hypothetical protein
MDRSWSRNLVMFVTVVLTVTSPCRGQPRESTHPSVAPQTKEAQEPLSETCQALLDRSWRDQERYVWTRLCDGKPADLDDLYGKT